MTIQCNDTIDRVEPGRREVTQTVTRPIDIDI